jgi:hypothetical protein
VSAARSYRTTRFEDAMRLARFGGGEDLVGLRGEPLVDTLQARQQDAVAQDGEPVAKPVEMLFGLEDGERLRGPRRSSSGR